MTDEMRRYLQDEYGIVIDSTRSLDFAYDELLSNPSAVSSLLRYQQEQMGNCHPVVAGTLFAKRYSVLFMGLLEAFNRFDCLVIPRLNSGGIRCIENGCMEFVIDEYDTFSSQDSHDMREVWIHWLANHLTPLLTNVSDETKAKLSHMYSLISHNLFQVDLQMEPLSPAHANQYKQNLYTLIDDGVNSPNPLNMTFKLVDKGADSYYVRKHCCLAYVKQNRNRSSCCGTCPLLHT